MLLLSALKKSHVQDSGSQICNINGARCQAALFSKEGFICPQKNWEKWIGRNSNSVPTSQTPSCWEFGGGLVSSKPVTVHLEFARESSSLRKVF